MLKQKSLKGFTLIEILVVVALIAILTAITFIAINPAKNFQDTRNAQRSADVTQILNAVTQFTSEQGNTVAMLTNAPGVAVPLCSATPLTLAPVGTTLTAGTYVTLEPDLVDEYIVGIPTDPLSTATVSHGYTICQTAAGRITIAAPLAEGGKVISVSR